MSHYQSAPPPAPAAPGQQPAMGRALKRPGTLTALVVTTLISVISAVVAAVLVFVGGDEMAEQNIKDVVNDNPDVLGLPSGTSAADLKSLSGPIWDELISDRAGTLAARAGFAAFTAVCLLIFALCVRKSAAVWARVMITISAVLALLPNVLIMGDYEPDSVTLLSLVALVTALAAIVLCWLPGNNRYARERRSAG